MRQRFVIFLLVAVAVILAIVFWLRPVRPAANPEPTSMVQPTNNVPATPATTVTAASAAGQSVPGTPPAILYTGNSEAFGCNQHGHSGGGREVC
jgi:hypothetical protein